MADNYTRNVTQFYPIVKVEIIAEKDRIEASGYELSSAEVNSDKLEQELLSFNTSRGLAVDCPTFSVTLCWRKNWFSKIYPNDLVIISAGRPNPRRTEALEPIFFGLVDDVAKTWDFQTGKPQRSITITGRGFGKAFANFEVGMLQSANVSGNALTMQMLLMGETLMGCTAAQGMQQVLDAFLYTNKIDYDFGGGRKFTSYFAQSLNSNSDTLQDMMVSNPHEGSIWSFMKQIQGAPFNEMFWEIENQKPTLVLRETPFDQPNWNTLPQHRIYEEELINDNTRRSDLENYTVFETIIGSWQGWGSMAETGFFPFWYPPNYKKYGLRKLSFSTPYLAYSATEERDSIEAQLLESNRRLFDWNILNGVMRNGTLMVRGQNYYRVGTRVLIPHEETEYYVENVSHQYTMFDSFITTLGVTRGIYPQNRFMAPVGQGTIFDASVEMDLLAGSGAVVPQSDHQLADGDGRDTAGYRFGYTFVPDDAVSGMFTNNVTHGEQASDFVQSVNVVVNGKSQTMKGINVNSKPFISLRDLESSGVIKVSGTSVTAGSPLSVTSRAIRVNDVSKLLPSVVTGEGIFAALSDLSSIQALRYKVLSSGVTTVVSMSKNLP